MPRAHSRLVCAGCGHIVPDSEPLPFACPNAGRDDDTDHVLQRRLEPGGFDSPAAVHDLFGASEPNPFLRYRPLLHSYAAARQGDLSDADFVSLVNELDASVARVVGHGFRVTPQSPAADLAAALGLAGVLVKDETGNVSGTHKGRHLMGTMLWLRVAERIFPEDRRAAEAPLAIASCGNAALAAGVVARAANRPLETFIPPRANPRVVERLRSLGAHLRVCERQAGDSGDPCYLGFRQGVADGRLPFGCQGPDSALTLDGGRTLGWELVSTADAEGRMADDLFIQVGGGALASSCIQGLREARDLGALRQLPRILAVQAESASPLSRAYDRVVDTLLERLGTPLDDAPPQTDRAGRARFVRDVAPATLRDDVLRFAATHRSSFMWTWEEEPRSLADAILDDETYDWLEVVRGMLETGGFPVLVSDDTLREAHALARRTTEIPVDLNGTSGLAGALQLAQQGLLSPDRSIALLFTGVER